MDTLLITIGSFAGILVGAGLLLGCFIAIFVFVCSNESPERFFAIVWLVVFLLGLSLIISGAKSMRAIHPNHISSTTANTVVLSFFPKISTKLFPFFSLTSNLKSPTSILRDKRKNAQNFTDFYFGA